MDNDKLELATLEEIQEMAAGVLTPGNTMTKGELIEEYKDMYNEAAKLRLTVTAMDLEMSRLAGLDGYPKAIKETMGYVGHLIDIANGEIPKLSDEEEREVMTDMSQLGLDGDIPDTTTGGIEHEDWE